MAVIGFRQIYAILLTGIIVTLDYIEKYMKREEYERQKIIRFVL